MKKYRVNYYLSWDEPEEIEANSASEACEEMMINILDNIGFYIECEAEEIDDEPDEYDAYEDNKLEEEYRKEN